MDQSASFIILVVCGSLLGVIVNLVILYWVIRAAVSGALSKHRDELREMLRAR